jgi:hypothetical protein
MRRQYHFRKSERGLLAWDVHRLIDLAKAVNPQAVALKDIAELDENFWFDNGALQPTCRNVIKHRQLVEAADLTYPIILSEDGRVMDGMHRVAKAMLLEQSDIMAIRFCTTPEPDFIGINPDDLDYSEV